MQIDLNAHAMQKLSEKPTRSELSQIVFVSHFYLLASFMCIGNLDLEITMNLSFSIVILNRPPKV